MNPLQERMQELEKLGINRRQIAVLLYKKRLEEWQKAQVQGDTSIAKPTNPDAFYSTVARVIDEPERRQLQLVREVGELIGVFIPPLTLLPLRPIEENIKNSLNRIDKSSYMG